MQSRPTLYDQGKVFVGNWKLLCTVSLPNFCVHIDVLQKQLRLLFKPVQSKSCESVALAPYSEKRVSLTECDTTARTPTCTAEQAIGHEPVDDNS